MQRLKRRALGCLGACAAAVILLLALHGPVLRAAGAWLCVRTPMPRRADIIYVYAGGEYERDPYAAALFKKGVAPRVMTAGHLKHDKLAALGLDYTDAEVNTRVLQRHGVPRNRIVRVDHGASTWDETKELHSYMKQRGLRSAVLVTSNFHTRRVRMAAPSPVTNLDAWWKSEEDLITVNDEYLKLLFYFLNYRLGNGHEYPSRTNPAP